MRSPIALLTALTLAAGLVVACGGEEDLQPARTPVERKLTDPPPRPLTDREAVTLLNTRCASCHTTTPIKKARLSAGEWADRLERSKCSEATGMSRADKRALVHYLAGKYGR